MRLAPTSIGSFRAGRRRCKEAPADQVFPNGVCSTTRDVSLMGRALRSCRGATLADRVGPAHPVLDVDVRHGGIGQLERLERGLPCTWRAVTPTGGLHVWFRGVDFPTRRRIGGGIEVLRGNRLLTLSPSQRAGKSTGARKQGGTWSWRASQQVCQRASLVVCRSTTAHFDRRSSRMRPTRAPTITSVWFCQDRMSSRWRASLR